MARKAKRRQSARSRRPAAAATSSTAAARPPPESRSQAGRVGGDQSLVRSVEMSLAPGMPGRRAGGRIVLEGVDPAIPLDRVPYFTSDLARLGIVGAIMVALLFIGAQFVVPLVVR